VANRVWYFRMTRLTLRIPWKRLWQGRPDRQRMPRRHSQREESKPTRMLPSSQATLHGLRQQQCPRQGVRRRDKDELRIRRTGFPSAVQKTPTVPPGTRRYKRNLRHLSTTMHPRRIVIRGESNVDASKLLCLPFRRSTLVARMKRNSRRVSDSFQCTRIPRRFPVRRRRKMFHVRLSRHLV
jgi:hypothetical protein